MCLKSDNMDLELDWELGWVAQLPGGGEMKHCKIRAQVYTLRVL